MSKEWYYRGDEDDVWYGPLSYRDANSQARRSTMPRYLADAFPVKYAQVGTKVGTRGGDPSTMQPEMRVVFVYANGRQYLSGRIAKYNSDKVFNE